jgi:hypothetical protein
MFKLDTTIEDPENADFPMVDLIVTYCVDGDRQWSKVYSPSRQAIEWDGAHADNNFAIGSVHGCFRYCEIKTNPKNDQQVYVPNSNNRYGRKATITFNKGEENQWRAQAYLIKA